MNLKGPEAVPEAMLVAVPAAVPVQREIFLEYAEDRAYEPEINIIKAGVSQAEIYSKFQTSAYYEVM